MDFETLKHNIEAAELGKCIFVGCFVDSYFVTLCCSRQRHTCGHDANFVAFQLLKQLFFKS